MPLTDQHRQDLIDGIDALNEKRYDIDTYWAYYYDEQPDVWVNPALSRLFRNLTRKFSMNLCKLAVLTPLNRLWVESWDEESYKSLWQRLRLDREQKRIYKHALVAGESYVIGWRDDSRTLAGWNDARNVHLFHDVDSPGEKLYGIKLWEQRDGTIRANLYYADSIVRLVADPHNRHRRTVGGAVILNRNVAKESVTSQKVTADDFDYDSVDWGGRHDMGEVPVWRFSPDLWEPSSRLEELTHIQDVINKLRSNKMVASEMGAFPQRLYLTTQEIDLDELVADARSAMRLDPGEKEDHPTSVEQFDATPLENYDDSISAEIQNFFTVAHLPRHLLINPGADSSGDAIRADEGPFQEMVKDIANNFGYAWTDMMHALVGEEDKWDKPEWQDASINNSEAQAREFKELVEGGMPPFYAAKKAFQWGDDDAEAAGLSKTLDEVKNLSDRSPSSTRSQSTEDQRG